MSHLIGQSLGRYHILDQLGEGGMATVYKAYDTRLERHVAVKVILPQRQFSEKFLKRFEREAKALAKLSHPNIVKVLDYGEHEGLPYLVMEYLPGGTLKEKLTSQPMPWQEAAHLILPIASALEYAHQQKIVHRDIKPSNILLTQSGEPMLSDFGVAKILETEETIDLTGSGVGIGTPEYMAPEQGLGHTINSRADIYAMGVVLYEMVTGRKPYRADTPMAVMLKKATEPLPRPSQFVPGLPDFIEGLLIKALARNPENRYTDMRAFALALEGGGHGGRAAASKLESGKRGYPHAKYIGIAAGTLALFVVLAISVVGLTNYLPNLFAKLLPEATPGSPGQAVVTDTEPINLPTSSLPATEPVFSPSTTPDFTHLPAATLQPQFDSGNPEGFLNWWFHVIWAERNYETLWDYISLEFRERLNTDYPAFVDNWGKIGSIEEPITITFIRADGQIKVYNVKYTTLSRKGGFPDRRNDNFYLYFNQTKGHWEFK